MENFEEQPGIKLPTKEQAKKIGIILWIIGTIVLLILIARVFWWEPLEKKIYQQGWDAKDIQISDVINGQFIQYGKVQLNIRVNSIGIPDIKGTSTIPVIFIPQIIGQ
jgi:hypothetical protein